MLGIAGLDTSARLCSVQQTFADDPDRFIPVLSDDFETKWLPCLGRTVTVLTRYLARHAADCPLSIEPVELAYRVGLVGHSALT